VWGERWSGGCVRRMGGGAGGDRMSVAQVRSFTPLVAGEGDHRADEGQRNTTQLQCSVCLEHPHVATWTPARTHESDAKRETEEEGDAHQHGVEDDERQVGPIHVFHGARVKVDLQRGGPAVNGQVGTSAGGDEDVGGEV